MEGKTQEAAAAAAGMSERTARDWQAGPLPSETKEPRWWRTRADPFTEVWDSVVVPLLEADQKRRLQAKTVLEALEREQPGRFSDQHLRTLQRRIRDWRALYGPPQEVYFEQRHVPGREGQLDFTHGTKLEVTVGGVLFVHLLFELVLSYSGWRWVCLAFGETFEALSAGLQGALWALGGSPKFARSDNLSAATYELKSSDRRTLTKRFKAVLEHYGMESTRIRPRKSNENGVVEKGHDVLKTALEQALLLRGNRDFAHADEYMEFVSEVTSRLNARKRVVERLAEEQPHLLPLPAKPLPTYTAYHPVVRKWSTIRVGSRTYSVPSRLMGHQVEARLHPDVVEVLYGDKVLETMPRLRGPKSFRIDYRHVIWSLVTKPGAFARYRYREELFPSLVFRRAYDALCHWRGERADVEYVRILHLAASTMEADVERVLVSLLESGRTFDYIAVKQAAAPEESPVPTLSVPSAPDLAVYDNLLEGGAS